MVHPSRMLALRVTPHSLRIRVVARKLCFCRETDMHARLTKGKRAPERSFDVQHADLPSSVTIAFWKARCTPYVHRAQPELVIILNTVLKKNRAHRACTTQSKKANLHADLTIDADVAVLPRYGCTKLIFLRG